MSEFRCGNGHLMFSNTPRCPICGGRVASMDGISDGKMEGEIIKTRTNDWDDVLRFAVHMLPFRKSDECNMDSLRKRCKEQDMLMHDLCVRQNSELRKKYEEWYKTNGRQTCRE